jgi:hypothetical protein
MVVLSVSFKNSIESDSAATEASVKKPKEKKHKKEKVVVTVDVETLQDGLENMGVLVTQEYYFTQVETYTKEKSYLKIFNSTSEFTYSYDGKVTAGVDFEKIKITKDDAKKTISIQLPESEIQSVDIDTNTFKAYSEKDSLWNPIKLEDVNNSMKEFEANAKQKALDSGILERADIQAQSLIVNFVQNFPNASGYQIVFDKQ